MPPTNNSINNTSNPLASTAVTIDPGASGDGYVQFDINTTGEYRVGVDDTDGDAFKISNGSALGTNDHLVIAAGGQKTLPLQPSFLNTVNVENNVTGDDTNAQAGAGAATTSIVDRNNDMTEGNGAGTGATFTAPVSGVYLFTSSMALEIINTTGGETYTLRTSAVGGPIDIAGSNYASRNRVSNFYGANGEIQATTEYVLNMDAADTVRFVVQSQNGSKVDDIKSGQISGCLLA